MMSNDEHQPADQQPRDFATRKLTDPGATVNLNADDIAALNAAQGQENSTPKLSDAAATVSFRAEELVGPGNQPAQAQTPARDSYATVNLSADEVAQLRDRIQESSAADVTMMGPSDIVPPVLEGPSTTREIGEPLPANQPSSSPPAQSAYSPPAQSAYSPPAQSGPPPYQGYSQQPPPSAAPPAYQGYPQTAPPHEAFGPTNPGYSPPKAGVAFGPGQIAIGIGALLIIIALVLALL